MRRSPLFQLLLVRLRTFRREPEALFWTFGFPLVITVALGVAFRPVEGEPLPVVVVDGAGADALVARLRVDPELEVSRRSASDARRAFLRGSALAIVEPAAVPRLRSDPTRPESRLARARVEHVLARAAPSVEDLPMREPGTRYVDFVVPGLVGMNVMTVCLWGIGWNIVESRSKKLLRRLAVTPMKRWHYLAAFVLAHLALVYVTLAVVLGFAQLAFGVGLAGGVFDYLVVVSLAVLAFSAIGTLVASRTANVEVLSGMINAASLVSLVLGGVFFSTARFPEWVLLGARALPLTALVEALRGIALEGKSVLELSFELTVLAGWTVIAGLVGLRLFRWT